MNNELKVLVLAKRLAKYSLQITNNTSRFPKKLRFTLTNSIQNTVMDIYKSLVRANNRRNTSQTQLIKRLEYQTNVIDLCDDLLFYIELALEEHCIDMSGCEYWCRQVLDVKRMTIAWRNSDAQKIKS